MPRIMEQVLMICGFIFLLIIAFFLVYAAIEMIKDSIFLHRDKKYGFCPIKKDVCDAGGVIIHSGQVMKCFDCPRYKKWREDQEDQMERGNGQ